MVLKRESARKGRKGKEKERCGNGFTGMGYVKFVGKGSSFFQVKRCVMRSE